LPGSVYSVCGALPDQLNETVENIFLAKEASSKLKIIGVCFGHQIISKHFGANVEKLGRVGGIKKIIFDTNLISNYEFTKNLSNHP
jgi:anthranilate/para-aminobenzoate synthase component II